MSEDTTKNLGDERPFDERVLARFDAFDARFDSIDSRFNQIDSRFDLVDARLENLETRSYDTKPIWERALAAIMETQLEVGEIKTKVGVIEGKVDGIEAKVDVIETKVNVIETKVQVLENEIGGVKADQRTMRNELIDIRRELKHPIGDRIEMILKFFLEDREDIRDAEARIRELESKIA